MHEQHDRRYFKWGLTALVVIFISILLVVIFTNLPGFFSLLGAVGKILSPLVSGIVIAFLLNPIVNFVDLRLRPLLEKRGLKASKAYKISRGISQLFPVIFACSVLSQTYHAPGNHVIVRYIHKKDGKKNNETI